MYGDVGFYALGTLGGAIEKLRLSDNGAHEATLRLITPSTFSLSLALPGKMLVEIALVISQAGFCCSYLIYISETVSSLTPFSRIQILFLAMPLLMAMALIKVERMGGCLRLM